jgi:DNA mismatch repair protein MSH4
MQDMAYIIANATSRSLVLVDELGRATSTADGTGSLALRG